MLHLWIESNGQSAGLSNPRQSLHSQYIFLHESHNGVAILYSYAQSANINNIPAIAISISHISLKKSFIIIHNSF